MKQNKNLEYMRQIQTDEVTKERSNTTPGGKRKTGKFGDLNEMENK